MSEKKILLIITGSIASYKAMDLVRLLTKNSYDVSCVLTKSACEFITPLLASSLSGNKTYNELFSVSDELEMGHINLSRQSDLIVVAPATADFIAKIANGYADDLASCVILASNKKIMIAPAMNEKMWHNPATQNNLSKVLEQRISMVEPETDILACGEFGIGKMASPEKIFAQINDFFANQNSLKNKKVLITAGATYEPIDPVRFIGNRSSGKQAFEIAKIFDEMGADVKVIAGNVSEKINFEKEKIVLVQTAREMYDAVRNNLESVDIFVGCAAVADFRVKTISKQKIKKSTHKNLQLELEQNPDILDFVGNSANRPKVVVGFAAESENLQENAEEKLRKKNCDFVIGNETDEGKIFGANESEAILVSKKETKNLGKISKEKVAKILADEVVSFFKY